MPPTNRPRSAPTQTPGSSSSTAARRPRRSPGTSRRRRPPTACPQSSSPWTISGGASSTPNPPSPCSWLRRSKTLSRRRRRERASAFTTASVRLETVGYLPVSCGTRCWVWGILTCCWTARPPRRRTATRRRRRWTRLLTFWAASGCVAGARPTTRSASRKPWSRGVRSSGRRSRRLWTPLGRPRQRMGRPTPPR